MGDVGDDALGAVVRARAKAQVFADRLTTPRLDPSQRHHLLDVLRLKPDDRVIVADGKGSWRETRLSLEGDGREESAGVLDVVPAGPVRGGPRPAPAVTVAFALVKGDRPEWIVQKLTEIGVDRIVPLAADRSVVRWDPERARRSVERLRRVALEAAAQSRGLWLPEVTDVTTVFELARERRARGEPLALARPGAAAPSLAVPCVAVGPEGGWSPEELDQDLPAVGLGTQVLRSETAAVVAGALMVALRTGTVAPGGAEPRPGVGNPHREVRGPAMAEAVRWLSTKEASQRLGVTLRSLYRFIDEGDLTAYKFGRVIRLKEDDVERFIDASRIAPGDLEHLYPTRKQDEEPE